MTVTVRAMTPDDWPTVERIYQDGIDAGNATFESHAPTWEAFDGGKLQAHRFVAVDDAIGHVLGWVAAAATSTRPVYAGVIEHSVYVAPEAQGRGTGAALLAAFIESADAAGVWTIQSSVFPENLASIALHKRFGFRTVGTRERVARAETGPYAGIWRDTVLIERRATGMPTTPSQ